MIIALQTLIFFRESFLTVLDRVLRPYYKRIPIPFITNAEDTEEEEPDEQVFSEFDDEKGVIFFPPMYSQRYAAVSDCLMDERWRGKLEKVVDFGYHDMSFIRYLKEVPGIQRILGVDIESMPLRCSSDLFGAEEYAPRRESPLQITLFQGNAADPDYRLIGCDAVISIEMIEHMLPHDLDRLVHNVFGFIKPWIAVFTTPNGDFNVLFKSLEKNGYRRLDHYFEWSREQFNEWCSNIIFRYPNYSVTCQGIGPGPPGTLHYGCCSQLALFVNKAYHKQQDLNINSLALVPMPSPPPASDMDENWGTAVLDDKQAETERIGAPYGIESLTEFICNENQSNATFVYSPELSTSLPLLPAPTESEQSLSSSDKISQCNLDSEYAKSFLMFTEDDNFLDIRLPMRTESNKVYNIEDVACRLNCSTLQIKKFSKTAQNLMARNKLDSLVHTREVVDEIRQLTKTLKFNKCILDRPEDGSSTWCNINWGADAPYWNQYYKVVKEYNCPFETKSEECRILDLISEEINYLIDTQCDEATTCTKNRLEIPLADLMSVVQHITDDINMVRDLLVWNGYEIVNDVVIHSRLAVDAVSVGTHDEDWPDNVSNSSDWDNVTEVPSTTITEGSTIVPDYQDRCLRRALDRKLRNLRTMLTADEDITTELDKVVCKLMKLALRTSKRLTTPPPAKWMQCKLLDLLTLTEKAIQRRKKHVIEASFTAIKFDFVEDDSKQKITNHNDREEDNIEKENKDGYSNIIELPPGTDNAEILKCGYTDLDPLDDIMSSTSNELKDYDFAERMSSSKIASPITLTAEALQMKSELNPMERTKAWLNVDVEAVPYHKHDSNYENNSSEESNSDTNLKHKQKRLRHRAVTNKEKETQLCLTSSSRTSSSKYKSKRDEKKRKTSSTRVTKKVTRKISTNYNIIKNSDCKNPTSYDSYIIRPKRKTKENQCLTMRASKPIPESLIELCHPELKCAEQCVKEFNILNSINTTNNVVVFNQSSPTPAGEESILRDIIMDDTQERLSICEGTGINDEETEIADISNKDQMEVLSNDIDVNLCTRHEVSTENICAQTIFLNDINEPSTSKGIRHNVSMDVQCGPDTLAAYPMPSASTSLARITHGFSTGIKIREGTTDAVQGTDFGTSTQECACDKILTPRSRSIGIKIKDSDVNICPTFTSTVTQGSAVAQNRSSGSRYWNTGPRSWSPESNTIICEKQVSFSSSVANSSNRTEVLKPISSISNYSGSEFCASDGNIRKSLSQLDNSTTENKDIVVMKSVDCEESKRIKNILDMKNCIPKLSCGGVHVHSYKDKQESEDIVYQGKWQRQCEPKITRKKTQNTILAKKIYDSGNRRQKELLKDKRVNSREKISVKKPEKKEYKVDYKKTLQMRNNTSILHKAKQEVLTDAKKINPHRQSVKTANTFKLTRPVINVTKVASKIAMSSITSKNIKSAFTTKKPQITTTNNVKKDSNTPKLKKSYIPLYMRKRNAQMLKKHNLNENGDPLDFYLEENKETGTKDVVSVIPLKTDEIQKDLLHFQGTVTENTYLVFCNENQDNCASTDEQQVVSPAANEDNIIQNDNYIKRTRSHQSLNSSTCSSPNSIVTVRAVHTKSKNLSYRRHSASSHKSSLNTSESDNATPTKTKKILKRCKTAKRSDNSKDSNNKENIPESAQNFSSKDGEKFAKSPYVGHQQQLNSICIAQLKADRPSMQTTSSKHKTLTKSNIKIPTPQDTFEKKRSLSASVSRKRSFQSRTSSNSMVPSENMSDGGLESDNMVLVLNPQERVSVPDEISPDSMTISIEDNVDTAQIKSSQANERSNIAYYMQQLIEESLNLINFSSTMSSKSGIVCTDDALYCSVDANDSMSSFVTVTANYLNSTLIESDNDKSLNRTFDTVLGNESIVSLANTRLTVTDLDLLSFKSVTSVSKDSEYYMANSELNATIGGVEFPQGSGAAVVPISVTDIFERKEQHLMQNPTGSLALQAFSGFSLDGEHITSDLPEPVNLIDSETGSMAMGQTRVRHATSEELFISGRSSESYQSCLIDEDAVVPNWLFQMISQQHSVIEDPPMIGPQPEPIGQDDSDYDINGNPIEPGLIDAAAGAGDGHGIHSDQSQDSSGRGTSLSSSDTSSSPQSEPILVDPSAFSGQIELRDPATTSSAMTSQSANEDSSQEECARGSVHVTLTTVSHRRQRPFPIASSDISADISSIDTDAPDSSD